MRKVNIWKCPRKCFSSAENKIKVEPVVSSLTSQHPTEMFDFIVYCSLTEDTSKAPAKPQQKLISNQVKKIQ